MPHEEARQRIAGMPLVTRDVFDGLLPELKAYAFTVTGVDAFDQLARIREELAAVPAGTRTWQEAKKTIAADLSERLGGKEAERRAELLLRTHTFRGYAVARYRSLMEQVDVFPYWQYKTHGDGRVRPSHAALNGKILPAGHPVWQKIFPPWDWGCRCLVVPMSGREVGRMAEAEKDKVPEARRVWDGAEADAIHAGDRLPNGISILPSQTWGSSPWSVPGTVQHTWQLVQERYGHDPAVLDAFRDWAQKTEIPDINMTVGEWLGGGRATFAQPGSRSRWGGGDELPPDVVDRLRPVLTSPGAVAVGARVPDLSTEYPPAALRELETFESEVATARTEHAIVIGPQGAVLERRRNLGSRSVSVSEDALPDALMSHNHPGGGPPSVEDVNQLLKHRMRELRVVTAGHVFRVRAGSRGAGTADVTAQMGFDQALSSLDILVSQLAASMHWDAAETERQIQHGLLAWLADSGIIHYERLPR